MTTARASHFSYSRDGVITLYQAKLTGLPVTVKYTRLSGDGETVPDVTAAKVINHSPITLTIGGDGVAAVTGEDDTYSVPVDQNKVTFDPLGAPGSFSIVWTVDGKPEETLVRVVERPVAS